MKPKRYNIYVVLILIIIATFWLPFSFWTILWLDIVVISAFLLRTYHPLLIVAIIVVFGVLFLWIFGYTQAATRLTHLAYIWALAGLIRFTLGAGVESFKKKITTFKGSILGGITQVDDPVLEVIKEVIVLAILTLTYVLADIFIHPHWWV